MFHLPPYRTRKEVILQQKEGARGAQAMWNVRTIYPSDKPNNRMNHLANHLKYR